MKLARLFKQRKKVTLAVVLLGAILVAIAQMALQGWSPSGDPGGNAFNRTAMKHLHPLKKPSLEKWTSRKIGDESAVQFASARTSLVLTCEFPLSITTTRSDDEANNTSGESDSESGEKKNHSDVGGGTATAITSDGYWLTAAHVVEFTHIYLASIKLGEQPPGGYETTALHPVRVVWTRAKNSPDAPDLALIHCSHPPERHFQLLRAPIPTLDTEVLASGYGADGPEQSGGRILRRGPEKGIDHGPRWMEYLNDAPLVPGDSGGPLLNAEGELLGINVSGDFACRNILGWERLVEYRSRTVCPDTDWIRKLIVADRAEMKRKSEFESQSNRIPSHPQAASTASESATVLRDF